MAAPGKPVRLIALDIDGTLVGSDLVLGPRTRRAVAEATRRGIAISLVTGRMATSALPFAEALHLTGPIVAHQGALVRAMPASGSNRLGRLLYHKPLSPDVTAEVVRWSWDHGLSPHFNHLEKMIVASEEPRIEEYRAFVGGRLTLVDDLLARARHPVTKIVVVGDGEHPLELLDEARARFAGRAEATLSHPRFLEFLAPGVSKGYGIRWLARRLGVPLELALAIGDQYNDLEMLAEVGHGAAMPTAPAAVRAAARYVAPPVEEEGAAQMIEAIALGEGAGGREIPDAALHVPEALAAARHEREAGREAGREDRPAHGAEVSRDRDETGTAAPMTTRKAS